MSVDWHRVADERLRLAVEIGRGDLSPKRRREIYDRLLVLHLTPDDIQEHFPDLRPGGDSQDG